MIVYFGSQGLQPGAVTLMKVEETKNCLAFDISIHSETNELTMAVLMKKSISLFIWQSTTSSFLKLKVNSL